jgi:uroporphyrinogen decarboxylase
MITHKERLEHCLAGEISDRTPVALWRHFPVDDQASASLAAAVLNFQRTYDFDLVKVTPASSYCIKDWGAQDRWDGATEGTRTYTGLVIQSGDEWGKLPLLEPAKGFLGQELTTLRLITGELGDSTPVIQTIFNPLSQAKNLVGTNELLMYMRQNPDALHQGLKIITESTRRFIDAASQTGIAGIFFAVQHAQYQLLSETEYETFGRYYDLQVLEAAQGLWLNMLHLHGTQVMFDKVTDYPVQIINWHDRDTFPSLEQAQKVYPGVLCGGLQREKTMVLGTPQEVALEAADAIQTTRGKRFILGTGCVIPITTPFGNLMAARRSVEIAGKH